MGDLLDQVHAQSQQQPQGDLLDQVHAQSQQAPQTPHGFMQTALSDLADLRHASQGFWDYTVGGAAHLLKGAVSLSSPVGAAAVNLMEGKGPFDPDSAGVRMVKEVVQAHVDQAQKAKAALDKGDYSEAFGHTLATALPFVGPAAAHIGETAGGSAPVFDKYGNTITPQQQPDIPRAVGQTAGLVAGAVLGPEVPAAVSSAADTLGENAAALRSLNEANPKVYSAKLFTGRENAPLIPKLGEAFEDLKGFGGKPANTVLGNPKVGVEDLAPTKLTQADSALTETAIAKMQEEGLAPWMDRARVNGWTVPGDAIVQGRIDAIPQMLWDESPKSAEALVQEAQDAYGGRQLTVDEARDLLTDKNKGSAPFQRQGTSRQGTSEVGATPTAIESADAGAIRDALYKTLDPENDGAGPQEIQRRTGNQIALKNAAEGAYGPIMQEKAGTILGGFGKPVANLAAAAMKGKPTSFFMNLGHPWDGPSDAMITKLYREAGPAAPLPKPPPFRAQVSPAGLLEVPPARLGGAMGTQYDPMMGERPTSTAAGMPPEWQQNVWRGAGAPRQLPPGSAPFTRGTSVPDTTVVPGEMPRGTPYTEVPAGPSRQLPPAGFNTPGAPIAMPPSGGYPSGSSRYGQPEFLRRGAVVRPMEPERGPYPASQLGPEPPPQEIPTPINRQEAGPGYGSPVFPKEKVAEFAKMNDLTPEKALAELAKEGYVVK